MQITILGGTGDIGEGLALRWGRDTDYQITIGSREPERASAAAQAYQKQLETHGYQVTIQGQGNEAAVNDADVVVLAVPPYHVSDVLDAVRQSVPEDAIVVSPAVGIKRDEDGFHYHRPGVGSVTAVAADAAPDSVAVVGAFHNLPANALQALDNELNCDTVVVGDDDQAKKTIIGLADAIDGIQGLDGGPLANAPEVEGITPLLINLAKYNEDLHDVAVTFH